MSTKLGQTTSHICLISIITQIGREPCEIGSSIMLYKKDDNVSFSSFRRLALSVTNSNSLHYITIQFLIAGVLGILFGTIWGGPLWLVGFLVFVPVIWFKLNTYESTIYIFSYYLFSLKPLPVLFSRYNNPFSKENFHLHLYHYGLYMPFYYPFLGS